VSVRVGHCPGSYYRLDILVGSLLNMGLLVADSVVN
jgi:hypothetical protein